MNDTTARLKDVLDDEARRLSLRLESIDARLDVLNEERDRLWAEFQPLAEYALSLVPLLERFSIPAIRVPPTAKRGK